MAVSAVLLILMAFVHCGFCAPISDGPDLETLQTQARYDPLVLAQDIAGSGAEACIAGGAQYAHGQKIWRPDPCESCLCLDGETFCWWQQCPQGSSQNLFRALTNATQVEFDPCVVGKCVDNASTNTNELASGSRSLLTMVTTTASASATSTSTPSPTPTPTPTSQPEPGKSTDAGAGKPTILESSTARSTTVVPVALVLTLTTANQTAATPEPPSAPLRPTLDVTTTAQAQAPVCTVLGAEYKIGAVLPRDTGNCLQCVCARGSGTDPPRITCSPHNCAPLSGADMFDSTIF